MSLALELRTILERIEAGDLDVTTSMRFRIQGAVTTLEVVLGRSALDVLKTFQDSETESR